MNCSMHHLIEIALGSLNSLMLADYSVVSFSPPLVQSSSVPRWQVSSSTQAFDEILNMAKPLMEISENHQTITETFKNPVNCRYEFVWTIYEKHCRCFALTSTACINTQLI